MKKVKIAINGFGRIGRITMRALLKKQNVEVVAINDLTDSKTLAHLFKYDSVQGKFDGVVVAGDKEISINNQVINIYSSKDPAGLPWKELNIDVVIESTGLFRTKEDANKHILAGAKKVIISAPAKSNVKTIVLGVNESSLLKEDVIISNASCTTNCAAPMVKILDELCGIETGFVSTVHSYTSDQRLHDAPHSDLRRARAANISIIPTTTGAAEAVVQILPHLKGKLGGSSLRVPVPVGSITEVTCLVRNTKSIIVLKAAFKKAAETTLKGILEYTEDPLVSCDIVGNTHSTIFDAELTEVIGNLVKLSAWYDNETGYSNRLADLAVKMGTI